MNFTHIIDEMNKASLFDLYRLNVAINKELSNPDRINAIKKKLYLGMRLTYFESTQNRSIKCQLIEMKPTKAIVLDEEKNKHLVMPYFMLNLDHVDTFIHDDGKRLTANMLNVGEYVGFNKDGQVIVGRIKSLNVKTASIITSSGMHWRVSYNLLHRVHNADAIINNYIEG